MGACAPQHAPQAQTLQSSWAPRGRELLPPPPPRGLPGHASRELPPSLPRCALGTRKQGAVLRAPVSCRSQGPAAGAPPWAPRPWRSGRGEGASGFRLPAWTSAADPCGVAVLLRFLISRPGAEGPSTGADVRCVGVWAPGACPKCPPGLHGSQWPGDRSAVAQGASLSST